MPASTWPGSRIPFLDENGDPMVGAKLRFFNSGTTTPQPVYSDAALATPIAQPILADSRGMFTRIFLNATPGSYRVRLTDAEDVVIFDDDDIAVAQTATYEPPDTGSTSQSLLFRTGMLQPFYGETAPSGWVRANGRTIGSATSGATERANADCQDLFLHLWTVDSSLTVSTGRGGSAASDWAANKQITLPDLRDRVIVGLPAMGASDAGLIDDAVIAAALGSKGGAATVTLTTAEIPAHTHPATFTGDALPPHNHSYPTGSSDVNGGIAADGGSQSSTPGTSSVSAGTPTGTVTVGNNTGGGGAHNNVQPGLAALLMIKL